MCQFLKNVFVFLSKICLNFLSHIVMDRVFVSRYSQMNLEISCLFLFCGGVSERLVLYSLKCLVEVVVGRFLNYEFNLFDSYRMIHVSYFFQIQYSYIFLGIYPLHHNFQIRCLKVVLNILFLKTAVRSIVLLLVLFICSFSFFALITSLQPYQFYYAFQKNSIGFVNPLY